MAVICGCSGGTRRQTTATETLQDEAAATRVCPPAPSLSAPSLLLLVPPSLLSLSLSLSLPLSLAACVWDDQCNHFRLRPLDRLWLLGLLAGLHHCRLPPLARTRRGHVGTMGGVGSSASAVAGPTTVSCTQDAVGAAVRLSGHPAQREGTCVHLSASHVAALTVDPLLPATRHPPATWPKRHAAKAHACTHTYTPTHTSRPTSLPPPRNPPQVLNPTN